MKENDPVYDVLLVDDHTIFRNGLLLALQNQVKLGKAYHASDGFEALKILHHNPVDIVFLDNNMPFMNGEECMKVIKIQFPKIKVIIISMMNSATDILTMISAGAHGYIVKNFNGDELKIAIQAVMAGRKYYDSYSSEIILNAKNTTNISNGEDCTQILTKREKLILKLITNGELTKTIAEKYKTSQETVKKHRKNILKKINGHCIADAIRYSLKNGIVNINEYLQGGQYRLNENIIQNKDKINGEQ